jgi:bifunctional DNA-binding transcriptional regulator/antitoxin component of YhaV-PrlF toxin-antitoxin module
MITKSISRKITSKGQVTIPQEIRQILKTDNITFIISQNGVIEIKPVEMSLEDAFGSVAVPVHLKGKTELEIKNILDDELVASFKKKQKNQL